MSAPPTLFGPTGPGIDFAILASAKSGTTWMQRLLCSHPQVHCAESRPFGDYYNPANLSGPHLSVEKFVGFLSAYYHAPVAPEAAPAFYRQVVFDVLDAISLAGRRACGKPIYGEKITPFLGTGAQVVRRLREYRPGLRFIHLVRDGRDVVVSATAQRLNLLARRGGEASDAARRCLDERRLPPAEFEEFTRLWTDSAAAGLEARGQFDHYLELRYEHLVANPEPNIAGLLAFIGADASPEVVRRCVAAASFERLSGGRALGQEDRSSFFRKGQPGDWANWFTPDQTERFEREAGDLLDRLGYPRAAAATSA